MTDTRALELTRRNYDAMAQRYADWVPGVFREQTLDLAMLRAFAELVGGQENPTVLDIGCGPGHVTSWMADLGLAARGIDLSPAMVELARNAHPELAFDTGSMLDLELEDASVGGVLAHFSIIHTPPADVPTAFAEFARVLAPGGLLLLSFQTGDAGPPGWTAFEHKVSPAFCWSIDAMSARLTTAGFDEMARLRVEAGPSDRFPGGHVLARKRSR
ncbi:Methyltransferase domain-containing protein [Nakamurella panacisegetis]|uniref:Methyltransferase domain-containing protein n=1 Tax=Nakamurella panacisegetis TaxID=1090615 RepID=A0A1H0MBU3_9ACTN|nr:class I SAM-dependent methyltransferase [Nakamurella panacisegetis]SDO77686.1 Methyltransferase domain-containing protein [Nakamurella panacisegetis]